MLSLIQCRAFLYSRELLDSTRMEMLALVAVKIAVIIANDNYSDSVLESVLSQLVKV